MMALKRGRQQCQDIGRIEQSKRPGLRLVQFGRRRLQRCMSLGLV